MWKREYRGGGGRDRRISAAAGLGGRRWSVEDPVAIAIAIARLERAARAKEWLPRVAVRWEWWRARDGQVKPSKEGGFNGPGLEGLWSTKGLRLACWPFLGWALGLAGTGHWQTVLKKNAVAF